MDYPKLRPVNVFPVQMSGQNLICLQDPENISEKSLFISPRAYYVLTLFDGRHSALDIQAEYMRKFGELLYAEKLQEIVGQLDEHLYLENERFKEALEKIEDRFKKASVREAAFAGKSYEAHPEGLRTRLNHYFDQGRAGTGGSKGGKRRIERGHCPPYRFPEGRQVLCFCPPGNRGKK